MSSLQAAPAPCPLVKHFYLASKHLKYPKMTVYTSSEHKVLIKLAGSGSKYAGSLLLTNGKSFHDPDNLFYGTITPLGDFQPSYYAASKYIALMQELAELLETLIDEPVQTAKLQGQHYGSCCFCSRELTDKRSYTAGYGPVCADKYGLPWGEPATPSDTIPLLDL